MSIRNFTGSSSIFPNSITNIYGGNGNIMSAQEMIDLEKERETLKINTLKEQLGLNFPESNKEPHVAKKELVKKNNKYNDEKYIKRRAEHDKKKQRKKNNLRKLQTEDDYHKAIEVAHAKFDEYVKKLNLTDTIKKAQKAGLAVSWGLLYSGKWAYWGLVKKIPLGSGGHWTAEVHGIGVAVDPKYLNVLDDQLLMFNQDELVDGDRLDTSNLGGFVIHGDDIPQCDETKYDNNIKCIDTVSSQANIIKMINDTLIDTDNNKKLDAYVIGINMHGDKSGYLFDQEDLVSKTINAFDTQQKEGIKINKPCLILKNSCFDARKAYNQRWSGDETDIYDELCKKVSNCTNEYTVCAYHNSKNETNWGMLKNVFASSYDYAFDLYQDGNLIQKNITAEEMNKCMNNTLNNGTWDIPDSREDYIDFMEQLVPDIKNQTIDTEPLTSTIIGQSTEQLKETEPLTSAVIKPSTEQLKEQEPSTSAVIKPSTEQLTEPEQSTSTFIEQTEQPKEQEPSTEQQQQTNNYNGLYGGLGLLGATAATIGGVIGCCYKKKKCCFKQKLNYQNQNKQDIKNNTNGGTVEIYQNKESDREYIANKVSNVTQNVTQKQILFQGRGKTKRATTPNRGRNTRRQNGDIQNLAHSYSDVKTFALNNNK